MSEQKKPGEDYPVRVAAPVGRTKTIDPDRETSTSRSPTAVSPGTWRELVAIGRVEEVDPFDLLDQIARVQGGMSAALAISVFIHCYRAELRGRK